MSEQKPEEEATPQDQADKRAARKKITKKEAVRRSLAKLGSDALPTAIQNDIKKRFGIVMNTGHISTTKGELRRQALEDLAEEEPDAPQAEPEPEAEEVSGNRSAVALEDIRTLRDLLDRVGPDHLKTLIEYMVR